MRPINEITQPQTAYVYQEYPKYKYKIGEKGTLLSQVINTPAEERKLGGDWKNSPDEARA